MHHLHIDRFAGYSSPVHSLDPRVKLAVVLVFILVTVLTPDGYFASYGLYFAAVGTVLCISRVPVRYLMKRSLLIIPFVLAISLFVPFITPGPVLWELALGPLRFHITSTGLIRFFSLGLRAFVSFMAVIVLVSTTRFGDLMWAAGRLGMPSRLVIIVSFMYRYLFILIDEASHMMLARDLRSGGKKYGALLLASGGIVGALMVRSLDHAEKLYQSMLLRGYSGRTVLARSHRVGTRDSVSALVFLLLVAAGFFLGRMMHG